MDVVVRYQDKAKRITLPSNEECLTFVVPKKVRVLSYPSFLVPDPLSPFSFRLRGDVRGRILLGMVTFLWGRKEKLLELVLEAEEKHSSLEDFQPAFPENPLFPQSGSVLLSPGDYFLTERLTLTPPFHFAGMGGVVLFREGEVLRVEGKGEGVVQNVAFSLQGRKAGNVVVVLRARVAFENCVFQGGVREKLSWMGNGVVAARGASLLFRNCVFLGNEAAGILAEAETTVTVEDSVFVSNQGEGILAKRGSTLIVRRSRFLRNAWGMTCRTLCLFEGNEVAESATGGLCLLQGTEGVFEGNQILRNPVGVVWPRDKNILWGPGNVVAENRIPFLEE
ncbi:MAG: right-handed parallel beta-helix repeat-containing protein [Atribacterota bacterium]